VIQGYDAEIGMGALCIQYLYYWNEVLIPHEYLGDTFVHYFDYQLVQIYLNLTYTSGLPTPYRYVFDNRDGAENYSTEWRDSAAYSILEFNQADSGYNNPTINISPQLQACLGTSYTANYCYKNLNDYWNLYNIASCYGGMLTLMLTVSTYCHQFAIGDQSGATPLGQYYIDSFTDDLIRQDYELMNYTFTGGLNTVNGEQCPNYAPFAYDVFQVFTVPYIHNNFNYLVQEAVALQGTDVSNGGWLKITPSVNITISMPVDMNASIPDTLTPGDQFQTTLNTHIDTSKTVITINYLINITADIDLFFWHEQLSSVIQNQLTIDFSNPILQMALQSFGVQDETQFSKDLLNGMLTVDGVFNPKVIGQIFNCNFTFHINQILDYYFPDYAWLIDLFFKDIYVTINPAVNGYFTANLMLGSGSTNVKWDSEYASFPVTLTVPAGTSDALLFQLTNFVYGLSMQVNWWAGVQFGDLISWALPDINIFLGTWPSLSASIPFSGTLQLESYTYQNGVWMTASAASANSNGTLPSAELTTILIAGGIAAAGGIVVVGVIVRKKRAQARR
jgi:hypothetical protein